MSATFDPATLRFYEEEAPVYAASGPAGASRHLAGFLARLPAGARILELGCGGGRDAAAMLAAGFDVDPTDGSAALAREASRRLDRPVRVMRFDELAAVDSYDAVWAAACLLHVPRAGLPAILTAIARALRPGGLFHATFKATGEEGRDGYGRLFNQLTAAELKALLDRSGPWREIVTEDYIGGGYDNRQGPWVAVTARTLSGE